MSMGVEGELHNWLLTLLPRALHGALCASYEFLTFVFHLCCLRLHRPYNQKTFRNNKILPSPLCSPPAAPRTSIPAFKEKKETSLPRAVRAGTTTTEPLKRFLFSCRAGIKTARYSLASRALCKYRCKH